MHRGVQIRLEVIKHSNEAVFFLSSEEFWKVVEAVGDFARGEMCRGHFVGSFGVLFRRRVVVDFDGVNFLGFLIWRGVLIYIDSFRDGVHLRRRIVVDYDGVGFLGFLLRRGVLIYIDSFGEIVIFLGV